MRINDTQHIAENNVDEKLFRLLVANVTDCAIFMTDPNGYIISWNQGAEHINGYKEFEIIGKHISVFYTETDIKSHLPRKNLNEALKKGTYSVEGWRIKKNGGAFWASVVFNTIYNDNGHLVGFAEITRDITERKTTDEKNIKKNAELERRVNANTAKIITNELRFRKLIENSYDGLTLLDENLHVAYRSFSAERINGWSNTERAGFTAMDLVHPDDREDVKNILTDVIKRPYEPVMATYRTLHKRGHYIWIECVYTNMLNDLNINAIVCNFRDITEKKLAEDEIRRKSEQIEQLFERITDGFIALDQNMCYTYANKKVGEMLGIDPRVLIGKYVWDLYPDAVNSATYNAFKQAITGQRYVCAEDYYAPLDLWQENHIYPSPNGLSVFIRDISKRKEAEVKLVQNEQRFRELIENSSDVVVVTAFDGTITYISPNAKKTLGYNIMELTIEQRAERMHPDDKAPYRDLFLQVRDNPGKIYPFTYRIKNAAGHYLWIEGTVINLLHVPGVKGMVTNSRDVTDRKKQELQIEQNHIQLRQAAETQASILNALPSGIVLLNDKSKIIAVNQAWKKLTIANNLGVPNFGIGYNYLLISEKATGIGKEQNTKLAKAIKAVISGQKKEICLEYPTITLAATQWFQVIVAPWADELRKGVVISHIDITDRKLAEELQQKSEDNLRSVFENTDLSIVLFDSELRIVSFNNNAKHLAVRNYHKKLKIGATAFNYFSKQRKMQIGQILDRVKQNEIVGYESSFVMDDGSREWYDIKWVGVTNKKLANVGYIMTLKDITGKKNADLEREKITTDLLQRNTDLEQYAYIVSHNLRAPVANIMGLSNLLSAMEGNGANDDSCEILNALSISIHNLDKVIIDLNHILQVGKQIDTLAETVSLPALIDDVKAANRQLIAANNTVITCNFNAVSELKTLKSYLHNIFQNLIVNSIKYRRKGIHPVIAITSILKNGTVLITVTDNGKGIDLTKHGANLFGLYKRFDEQVEGRGLGLFMVKMQVENLGGSITVQSELGKGTVFSIELPLA